MSNVNHWLCDKCHHTFDLRSETALHQNGERLCAGCAGSVDEEAFKSRVRLTDEQIAEIRGLQRSTQHGGVRVRPPVTFNSIVGYKEPEPKALAGACITPGAVFRVDGPAVWQSPRGMGYLPASQPSDPSDWATMIRAQYDEVHSEVVRPMEGDTYSIGDETPIGVLGAPLKVHVNGDPVNMEAQSQKIFEVLWDDGNKWTIYAGGRTEGFPEGMIVINRISLMQRVTTGMWTDASVAEMKTAIAAFITQSDEAYDKIGEQSDRIDELQATISGLAVQCDRHADANSKLGAENEKLRDELKAVRQHAATGADVVTVQAERIRFLERMVPWYIPITGVDGDVEYIRLQPREPSILMPDGTTRPLSADDKYIRPDQGPNADYHGPRDTTDPSYPAHKAVHDVTEHLMSGRVTNQQARGGLRDALDKADVPIKGKAASDAVIGRALKLEAPSGWERVRG